MANFKNDAKKKESPLLKTFLEEKLRRQAWREEARWEESRRRWLGGNTSRFDKSAFELDTAIVSLIDLV